MRYLWLPGATNGALQKALNLFNAALVTPTYYVFFTSATIVTSAVLFQGFKGTPATIATVIMGFLQICAGVILLQLSKSAKDVPDSAVFKGDLDQVRTIAEQEEPEFEPRADTVRGSGAIIRSISRMRSKRELDEAKKLQDENMSPIGENEMVEWDGLRRRKTVLEPGQTRVPQRTKTVHPPLGMSHFPDEDDNSSNADTDIHPGFFPWRRRSRGTSSATNPSVQLSSIKGSGDSTHRELSDSSATRPHTFGLPFSLQRTSHVDGGNEDTAYHGGSQHIHFSDEARSKSANSNRTLAPPRPPPHSAKRQFSFQNVFSRHRAASGDDEASLRPTSSGTGVSRLSFNRKSNPAKDTTEEERLGLVKGDSRNVLGGVTEHSPSPPRYDDVDDDWRGYEQGAQGGAAGGGNDNGSGSNPVSPALSFVREESPEHSSAGASRERQLRPGAHALPPLPFERGQGPRSNDDYHDADDDDTPTSAAALRAHRF